MYTEPLVSHNIPDKPYIKVGVDLFQIGNKTYMLVVDYFSKYPEVKHLQSTISEAVIDELKEILCRLGIPQIVAHNLAAIFINNLQMNSTSNGYTPAQCTHRVMGKSKDLYKQLKY